MLSPQALPSPQASALLPGYASEQLELSLQYQHQIDTINQSGENMLTLDYDQMACLLVSHALTAGVPIKLITDLATSGTWATCNRVEYELALGNDG